MGAQISNFSQRNVYFFLPVSAASAFHSFYFLFFIFSFHSSVCVPFRCLYICFHILPMLFLVAMWYWVGSHFATAGSKTSDSWRCCLAQTLVETWILLILWVGGWRLGSALLCVKLFQLEASADPECCLLWHTLLLNDLYRNFAAISNLS